MLQVTLRTELRLPVGPRPGGTSSTAGRYPRRADGDRRCPASVVDYAVDVMSHWLARGVDGWRLDAAYAVPESFWAQVIPRVRDLLAADEAGAA